MNSGVTLNLNALTVADGSANGSTGGGIYNDGGTVTVSNSTVSDNRNGIVNDGSGTVTLENTIVANSSPRRNASAPLLMAVGTSAIPIPPALASTATPCSAPCRTTADPPKRWR